jgi:hypothetical protein
MNCGRPRHWWRIIHPITGLCAWCTVWIAYRD